MPRINRDDRTPAHFRAMREAHGIARPDLVHLMGVRLTSVRDWDLRTTAPDEAWRILDGQARWVEDTLTAITAQTTPGPVSLGTYRSDEAVREAGLPMRASWHRAGTGIIATALEAAGYSPAITYLDE
ncbi:hypothetical protein [Actinomyces faecalis]|uniref:hypothetical protein n=1 Tax=Actinomyces faecalis TaxID=2722820 RepID=UPI001553FBF6|nr:hypothetical protein [Actinomyces faecalis]